jgi:hypothetical protein
MRSCSSRCRTTSRSSSSASTTAVQATIADYLDGRADVIGELLPLNGVPHRVVAVVPDDFDDPLESDGAVWTPLNLQPGGPNSFDNYYLSIVARLRSGVTLCQRSELFGQPAHA